MQAHMQHWQAWFTKLGEEGKLKDWGSPLQQEGKRVVAGGVITDGPYAEGKEVIGGFWIIQVNSKQEAIEWAQRCPAKDGDVIEIRQVWEMSELPK